MATSNKTLYAILLMAMVVIILLPTIFGNSIGLPLLCFATGVSATVTGLLVLKSIKEKTFTTKKVLFIVGLMIVVAVFYLAVMFKLI
jgi:hypothetical protein